MVSRNLTPTPARSPPQALAETRIGELFDIVVDFPESAAALDDLRACLQRTQQHGDAVNGLGEALEARLLKPGADTSNVIQVGRGLDGRGGKADDWGMGNGSGEWGRWHPRVFATGGPRPPSAPPPHPALCQRLTPKPHPAVISPPLTRPCRCTFAPSAPCAASTRQV